MQRFLQVVLVLLLISSAIAAAKKAKDWSKIDFDKVEEEWKAGDSEEELITPDEVRWGLASTFPDIYRASSIIVIIIMIYNFSFVIFIILIITNVA